MKTLSDGDVAALEEMVQLLSRRTTADAVRQAIAVAAEAPARDAEVRRLRAELDEARREAAQAARPVRADPPVRERPEPSALEIEDDATLGLAAAFRVGPREVKAAQDDPLVALAVQVARAMGPEPKEIERARLLAMALAAAKGDLDAFWTARRMRTTKPSATKKK